MTKSARSTDHRKGPSRRKRPTGTSDVAIYVGLVIIGLGVVGFGWLLSHEHWRWIVLVYVAFVAYLVNLNAVRAYRGRRLGPWQQALARLPLRCVGFGTRHGRPVDAAHGIARVRTMILVSIVVSLIVVAGLVILFMPHLAG